MEDSCRIDSIDVYTLDALLRDYPDVVPDKLTRLDQQRYETLPRAVREREEHPFLSKSEVAVLVDWKLSHGKFRPALKGLLGQNLDQVVLDVTKDAFAAFEGSSESAKTSLNALTKLRGIGPATASLLLSVYDPQNAPFFSDELFRWCIYEEGKGKGWDRHIKYNLREYLEIFDKVHELQNRLIADSQRKVAAVDIEKVAYVLGKRALQANNKGLAEEPSKGMKRKKEASEIDSLQASNGNAFTVSKREKREKATRQSVSRNSAPRKRRANIAKSNKKAP